MTLRYNQGDHWCVVTVMLDKDQIPIGKKIDYGFSWDPVKLSKQLELGHSVVYKHVLTTRYEKGYSFIGDYCIGMRTLVVASEGRKKPFLLGADIAERLETSGCRTIRKNTSSN